MRKDLTISLDEEHINELLEVAEKQNITLSALIRTIVASYLQAVRDGRAPVLSGILSGDENETLAADSSLLSQTVAYHGKLIDELQKRVAFLEGGLKKPGVQTFPSSHIPDIMTLTSPALGIASGTGVIDTDLRPVSGLSNEALVKMPLQPIAPVMDAMEMGSMKIHPEKEYSQTEAAVALRVSVSTMRKYIKDKKIPARKVGRSWLIQGANILSFNSET